MPRNPHSPPTSVPSAAAARLQVAELLRSARDRKLLLGGAAGAIDAARRAYRLAGDHPELRLDRAQAAYHLAHLLLRSPDPVLEEADALFTQAARSRALGPWPRIYRLAVLSRLGQDPGDAHRRACEAVADWVALAGDDDGPAQHDSRDPRLQLDVFNLLELATYFLGLPYDRLAGIAAREPTEHRAGGFLIVGPEPEWARVRRTREEALEELANIGRARPTATRFRLEPGCIRWNLRGGAEAPLAEREARLLATVLEGRVRTQPALREAVMGEGAKEATFRQVKSRLFRKLGADALDTSSGRVRLREHLEIFGVVDKDFLDAP